MQPETGKLSSRWREIQIFASLRTEAIAEVKQSRKQDIDIYHIFSGLLRSQAAGSLAMTTQK